MTIDRRLPGRRGFTLIELLVVIGIMLVLMAILLPVVSKVRIAAYDAATQSEMERILGACESYYHDFNSYPGPIANVDLSGGTGADSNFVQPTNITGGNSKITSSENLVLGLFGMLNPPSAVGGTVAFMSPSPTASNPNPTPPHDLLSLNYLHPQSYHYLDFVPTELSVQTGMSKDLEYAAGATTPPSDTNVPEFIDLFGDPMPILYIRANTGATGVEGNVDTGYQYNYTELKDYGCNVLMSNGSGTWMMFGTSSYFTTLTTDNTAGTLADSVATPFTDWGYTGTTAPSTGGYYLMNPNLAGVVRGKDGFILIGAGKDRVYGTADDTILTP